MKEIIVNKGKEKEEFRYLLFNEFGDKVKAIYTEKLNFNGRRIVQNTNRDKDMKKLFQNLGITNVFAPKTFHTNNIINLDEKTEKSYTHENYIEDVYIHASKKHYDGVIGRYNKKPVIMFLADCIGIYVYDEKTESYGLFHAGWKGVLGRIFKKGLNEMINKLEAKENTIKILFSPSISYSSFEVEDDVKIKFEKMLKKENLIPDKYIKKKEEKKNINNKYLIDLFKITEDIILNNFKIKKENIFKINEDTVTTKLENGEYKYHSHRRDKEKAGRNIVIMYVND